MMKTVFFGLVTGILVTVNQASGAFIINGSFENGTNPGAFLNVANAGTDINNWTVLGNSVDYIGTFWTASHGFRSLDLNGTDVGGVSQTFATVMGEKYKISFDLSGNPGGPTSKTLEVLATGGLLTSFSYSLINSGTNMMWATKDYFFTASGVSTTLSFVSTTIDGGVWGPALDNVTINVVPEPATLTLAGIGALGWIGVSIRRRRNK